jgi:hypothetical protein
MLYSIRKSKEYCNAMTGKGKGRAIPVQAWAGPEISRTLRLQDFMKVGT